MKKLFKHFINWFLIIYKEDEDEVKGNLTLVKVKSGINSFNYEIKIKDDAGNYHDYKVNKYKHAGHGKLNKEKDTIVFNGGVVALNFFNEWKETKKVTHKGIDIIPIILVDNAGSYYIRYVAEHYIGNYYRLEKHPQSVINWLDEYEKIGDIVKEVA